MRHHRESKFRSNDSGAVAAAYALALPALIAVAAVGFDYARLAGMDSELQNAADQAALAAASQLDGKTGACARASAAAVGLVANQTLIASGANAVTVPPEATCDATGQIRFWQNKTKTTAATSDANARFVEVAVDVRTVDYALLPLVHANSATIGAAAFAGLGSAVCKLPPVMMCNPNETDLDFTTANYAGKGVRLVANVNGKNNKMDDADEAVGSYGPGVFGYLETSAGNGASATAQTLGRVDPPGTCFSTEGADIKPGQQVSVLDALNTRFGIFDNGLNNPCGTNDALCPPSDNARIDLVQKDTNNPRCNIQNNGFQVGANPYRPDTVNWSNNINPAGVDPMGYPRDKCHAVSETGACTGNGNARVGDGDWDRNAYYATNGYGSIPTSWSNYGYPELTARSLPTRFQQYRYEYTNKNTMLAPKSFGTGSNKFKQQGTPLCTPPAAIAPGSTPDRRVLSVAVINCAQQNVGASTTNAKIVKFVDVFLVEPTARRVFNGVKYTRNSDVYVEIIGATRAGGGGSTGQVIRKDTPYLIE